MVSSGAGSGRPNRALIASVADLLERLPARAVTPGESVPPIVTCTDVASYDGGDLAYGDERGLRAESDGEPEYQADYSLPREPLGAFVLREGALYDAPAGHTAGGVLAATLLVSERDAPGGGRGGELDPLGGTVGSEHLLAEQFGVDLDTAVALSNGTGLTVSERAVTGPMAATALRAVLDGSRGMSRTLLNLS